MEQYSINQNASNIEPVARAPADFDQGAPFRSKVEASRAADPGVWVSIYITEGRKVVTLPRVPLDRPKPAGFPLRANLLSVGSPPCWNIYRFA